MTNLQLQFTSLEMSKRLAEAGFRLDTPFWWVSKSLIQTKNNQYQFEVVGYDSHGIKMGNQKFVSDWAHIPCYTFQQLWEALPIEIEDSPLEAEKLKPRYSTKAFSIGYEYVEWFYGDSLPDTAGEAILWCMENNYISVEGNDD